MINKLFKKESKYGINLGRTIGIIKQFGNIFKTINTDINGIDPQKGKEMTASLKLLRQINKSIISNFSNIKKINEKIKEDDLTSYIDLFKNDGNLYKLFNNIKTLNTFDNANDIIKSINDFGVIQNTLQNLSVKKFNDENIVESINQISELFNYIKELKKKIDEAQVKQVEEGIISLQTIIETIKTLKINKTTNKKVEDISNILFGNDNSLSKVFKNLKENVNDSIDTTVIDNIGLGVLGLKDIIDTINELKSSIHDPKELKEGLDEYLKVIAESYKQIKEHFDEIIATGELAEKVKASNKNIQEAMDNNNETIIKTSSKQEDIKKANVSLQGMTSFMIGAAIVMSIGALFVMLGGGKFIKAALQFGLTLAIFEGLVLLPALLFYQQKDNALDGIESFNSFVIVCAGTMLIGAIIYAFGGGKLVKNALAFGVTLAIFEALIIAPILLFRKSKKNLLQGINDFKKFVITTTVIMLIGALAVQLLGGKMIINALKFGAALMVFEALVVFPFILFGKLGSKVFEHAKAFTGLLIICTTVMLIGALFTMLGGGKFIKAAYQFSKALMLSYPFSIRNSAR